MPRIAKMKMSNNLHNGIQNCRLGFQLYFGKLQNRILERLRDEFRKLSAKDWKKDMEGEVGKGRVRVRRDWE